MTAHIAAVLSPARALRGGLLVLGLLVALLGSAGRATATDRYLAPNGDDNSQGSQQEPWQHFHEAARRLAPGDTLYALDGEYTASTNGNGNEVAYLDCSSGVPSGTSTAPITLKALHERRAHLQGNGSSVLLMISCHDWVIEGLYLSNVSGNRGSGEGTVMALWLSDRLTIRRNLVHEPNRYRNAHGIGLHLTNHSLVEENEVYYFHRHGIVQGDATTPATGNVIRRNYLHSRNAQCAEGATSEMVGGDCTNGGDEGLSLYPGNNALFENNIVEDVGGSYTIDCKEDCPDNRYLGNMALEGGGFSAMARFDSPYGNTARQMPTNNYYENNLSYHMDWWSGGEQVSPKNVRFVNNSFIEAVRDGITGVSWFMGRVEDRENGDGQGSIYGTNMLFLRTRSATNIDWGAPRIVDWNIDYMRSYDNPDGASPSLSDSHYTHVSTNDPNMGSCLVFIPSTSNLKGAGKNGADIGANILYRYENGVLTTTPLWDPTTGQFTGCGAIVSGVNDLAGSSCFDVNQRLHVNAAGCYLPAGYGGGEPPPPPPPPPAGLMLLLSLEEASGTTAADSSGHGFDATFSSTPTRVQGRVGTRAVRLDGISQHLTRTNFVNDIAGAAGVTLALYVQFTAPPLTGNHELLSLGDYVALRGTSTQLEAFYYGSDATWHLLTLPWPAGLPDTAWHHVAYVWTPTSQTLYLDGRMVASGTQTWALTWSGLGSNLEVGRHGASAENWLAGAVDDVRVYAEALSPSQIAALAGVGQEYFASPTGTATTCEAAKSRSTPGSLTLAAGCLIQGDTLTLLAGTYTEVLGTGAP